MKMKNKGIIVLLMTVLSFGVSQAQVGIQAGYTQMTNNLGTKIIMPSSLSGLHVGPTFNMDILGPVSVQGGLLYNLAQTSNTILGIKYTYSNHSLDIPIRVAFNVPLGSIKISAFAGPNFNIGIGYTNEYETKILGKEVKKETTNIYEDDDNSRYNVQLGGGVAIQVGNLGLKASYDLGMTELIKDVEESKTNTLKVGLYYNF